MDRRFAVIWKPLLTDTTRTANLCSYAPMSLSQDIQDELFLPGLYFDTCELAVWRNFLISDGTATGTIDIRIRVIWNDDIMIERGIELAPSGMFLGDVLMHTRVLDWPRRPRPNSYLESPQGTQYEIIKCIESHGVYSISLRGPMTNY